MNTAEHNDEFAAEGVALEPVMVRRDLAPLPVTTFSFISLTTLLLFVLYPILAGAHYEKQREITALWALFTCSGLGYFLSYVFPSRASVPTPVRRAKIDSMTLVVAIAILLGGTLRFFALDFDFPSFFHPDEARKSRTVLRMLENDTLNPNYFLHPTLLLYSGYFFFKVFNIVGVDYGKDAYEVVLGGRFFSAIAGVSSILLIYAIGTRLFSRFTGAFAACLLAVIPLHVTCSRYMKEDVIFSTFTLACVFFVIRGVQRKHVPSIYMAGLMAGFSFGSKYTGVLSALILGMTPFLVSGSLRFDKRWIKPVFIAGLLMACGFLICTPYSIANWPKFIHDFGAEARHARNGHGGISISPWEELWMYHLSRSVIRSWGYLPTLASLLGLGLLIQRRNRWSLFLLALILLFYLPVEMARSKPMPQPERYILPLLPFLALSAAEFTRAFFVGRARWLISALILVPPLALSLTLTSELRDDTRLQMAEWMNKTIAPRSQIIMVGEIKYLPRPSPTKFQLRVVGAERSRERLTVERLRASDFKYLVVTSLSYERFLTQPNADPVLRERFQQYDQAFPLVKEIRSSAGSYAFHNPILKVYRIQ